MDLALSTSEYEYDKFMKQPNCYSFINPQLFGYSPTVDADIFSISMDVRTYGDSIGINSNYLNVLNLNPVGNTPVYAFEYLNISYSVGYYIDNAYPGMSPLFCLTNQSEVVDPKSGISCIDR